MEVMALSWARLVEAANAHADRFQAVSGRFKQPVEVDAKSDPACGS